MTTKHAPATPLPWEAQHGALLDTPKYEPAWIPGAFENDPAATQDVSFIVHSANAYPKLVTALQNLCAAVERGDFDMLGPDHPSSACVPANALLRELGEAR